MERYSKNLMSISTGISYTPKKSEDYYPHTVKRLLFKIKQLKLKKFALVGFDINMMWLNRILSENNIKTDLYDWRDEFIGYDCSAKTVKSLNRIKKLSKITFVICNNDVKSIKETAWFLYKNFPTNNVIYDFEDTYQPLKQEDPYRSIYYEASKISKSMISENQLFDLAQLVKSTSNIEGDICEFGSHRGGTGAIIVQAAKNFSKKKIWLFDSFSGIPKSKYGLDFTWKNSFSDNSYSLLKNKFDKYKNVNVVKGNILKTHKIIMNKKISFAYIASDTLESAESLLNYLWPKISIGGIVLICDYGSYPNAIPLTIYVDKFFEKKNDAFTFVTNHGGELGAAGFFAIKK